MVLKKLQEEAADKPKAKNRTTAEVISSNSSAARSYEIQTKRYFIEEKRLVITEDRDPAEPNPALVQVPSPQPEPVNQIVAETQRVDISRVDVLNFDDLNILLEQLRNDLLAGDTTEEEFEKNHDHITNVIRQKYL
ncbi:hypothetical protein DJ568_15375 [Mucilaginibacter hurinus]|uniref:Uncharacterized protein n=2 Tax=Mucilaginibacter hurinus TaxID=2201324 RepID=A0A367GLQ0_9SPHI|nr:hypothetical protein DJ568_15375 [Mucilaginibacter hurinus]